MASGYEKGGTDLDSIFAPYHSGWPQAAVTGFTVGGVDINARYAPISTGSSAANTDYESTGTDLAAIFAASGTTGVQVATQPSSVSGSAAAGTPSGTVTSGTTTCSGTKGGGSYSFTWHIASGSASFTNPSGASTGVTNGAVPAATTISGTMFCTISDGVTSVNTNTVGWSLQNTTPAFTQHLYTAGSGTETAPAGYTHVLIEVWGGGAPGGSGNTTSGTFGGGGGASGYVSSLYGVTAGQTMNYAVGAPSSGSSVSSGTLPITTMISNTGTTGTNGTIGANGIGGPGGTASGGNQANVTGGAGANGSGSAAGGVPSAGVHANASQVFGVGGDGNDNPTVLIGTGGLISFYYF